MPNCGFSGGVGGSVGRCHLVTVRVEAAVCKPEARSSQLANVFTFTFLLAGARGVLRVLPESREEAEIMFDSRTAYSDRVF